jgi:hypothetical protein
MGAVVLRGTAGGEHALTFSERVLYHQIHPAKVYVDIATALVAMDLFWRHALMPALIVGVLPPLFVSLVLLGEADLSRYRASPMGAYVRRFMPPWLQAVRLFGVALAFYASWNQFPAGIYAGLALVAFCWANGLVRDPGRRRA